MIYFETKIDTDKPHSQPDNMHLTYERKEAKDGSRLARVVKAFMSSSSSTYATEEEVQEYVNEWNENHTPKWPENPPETIKLNG